MQRKVFCMWVLSLLVVGILSMHSGYAQVVPIASQVKTSTYTTNSSANLVSAGLTTVRFGIYYNPDFDVNGQNSTAWQPYDALIQVLNAAGTKVLMTAFIGPSTLTAQVNSLVTSSTTSSQKDLIVRQTVQGDLNTLVTQAIQRYGSTISAVEIWNEPDNSTFWNSSLGTFDNAMTGICDSISNWPIGIVYGYAFTQIPESISGDTSTSTQLYEALSNAGSISCLAGVSAHFYSTTPESLLTSIPYSQGTIGKPLLLTEFGASSDPSIRTDTAQAQLILRNLLSLFIAKPVLGSIYEWKDTASAPTTREQHYGMTDSSDTAKPVYTGLKNLYSLYVPSTSTTGNCTSGLCSLNIVQSTYSYTVYWRSDSSGTKLSTIIGNKQIMEKQLSLNTAFAQVLSSSVYATSTPIVIQTQN